MKLVLFYLILMVVFPFSNVCASVEKSSNEKPAKIARIEVGVKSREIRVFENPLDDEYWFYRAATASLRNSAGLPFGKRGVVWKIVLNPDWRPTPDMKKEAIKKGRKLKDYYPPNSKGNPLGKLKIFMGFHDASLKLYNSNLGIHTTTEKNSIGKRVSHGCTRLNDTDAFEIVRVILEQSGKSNTEISELFEKAKRTPKKSITLLVPNGPEVVYLNN